MSKNGFENGGLTIFEKGPTSWNLNNSLKSEVHLNKSGYILDTFNKYWIIFWVMLDDVGILVP